MPESMKDRAISLIMAQIRKGIPSDEMLVPPDIAYNADTMMLDIVQAQYGSLSCYYMGVRVGCPCPKCGRRKPNKGRRTCDGCGFPLLGRVQ